MKLIYIDESEDTAPLSQGGSRYFVLTGCVVDEIDRRKIEDDLRVIKQEFYANPDIEFKSNFVRYANPDIPGIDSPLKLHSRERYNNLEEKLTNFLTIAPVVLVSIVVDKAYYWSRYPAQNPYEVSYMFLLERLHMHLVVAKSNGLVIIDPREGRVEKSFIGDNLERLHHSMRFDDGAGWYKKTPKIVERLLYSDSKNTIGIQLADMYCYPVYHIFEHDKEPGDYWRFQKVTLPKFLRVNGVLLGRGLKIFSDKTKNGLL